MTTNDHERWREVEEAWRAGSRDSRPAVPPVGRRATRSRVLLAAELGVAACMLWLVAEALREHPGGASAILAGLLVAHAGAVLAVSTWNRLAVTRLLTMDTRTFLQQWRSACRRQLFTIRVLAAVLTAEAATLAYMLAGLPGARRLTRLPGESEWLLLAAIVLGSGAWALLMRSRALEDLYRIGIARAELDER